MPARGGPVGRYTRSQTISLKRTATTEHMNGQCRLTGDDVYPQPVHVQTPDGISVPPIDGPTAPSHPLPHLPYPHGTVLPGGQQVVHFGRRRRRRRPAHEGAAVHRAAVAHQGPATAGGGQSSAGGRGARRRYPVTAQKYPVGTVFAVSRTRPMLPLPLFVFARVQLPGLDRGGLAPRRQSTAVGRQGRAGVLGQAAVGIQSEKGFF